LDLSLLDWITIASCAAIVGISKTGIPGIGILAVPLLAIVFEDTNESTGLLLGILILADIFAIIYHRQNAKWHHIIRLLPATLCGIIVGYFGMKVITSEQLKPLIGVIVLIMLGLNYWRLKRKNEDKNIPSPLWLSFWLGFLAGVTTMMANAAGPVMIIYLIAMRLPKMQFVGTAAWFFFIVNWIKVPFQVDLGNMNWESVKINLMMLPFIFIGAISGYFFLKRLPQKAFTAIAQLLAAAAAVKLLF
jgi:uncharacterized membrane protein YfcA